MLIHAAHAATAPPGAASFLEQTERLRTADHASFLHALQQLRDEAPRLTPSERWYLRYLDAWQVAYEGNYAKADALLREVIDHSGDATLVVKASALLMDDMGLNGRYEEAFTLGNRLAVDLPEIKDKLARFLVLQNLSQLLGSAGQHDLAVKYAREMEQARPPWETSCRPIAILLAALYDGQKLTSSSTELQRGIDTCQAAGEPVFTNTMWLVKVSLYLDEGQPGKALALLHQIAPSIRANQYSSHMLTFQVELAQAHRKLGDDSNARKSALAALTLSERLGINDNESLRDTYEVLYRIEKSHGNAAAALTYYERYVAQNKSYLDDISARVLAYEMVQQHMLAQKLETERLSKQNSILRLQQALTNKAVETSRLYITLLLVTLTFIVFWLFRLKRSQLRFKKLSSRDGLTGILNHQHFISEADRVLRLLEKKRGNACLISIDLDHFKQVNDTHGHAMGDVVLRHTVATCHHHLRPADLFGRLGGEEFGILLPDCSREQGLVIADRIRAAIAAHPVEDDGRVVPISASVGLAATDTSGYVLQQLCREADAALYRAKRAGRNRVIAHTRDGGLVEA